MLQPLGLRSGNQLALAGNIGMSKLAKKLVSVPSGVTVQGDGLAVRVVGPKGELSVRIPHGIAWSMEEGGVRVKTGLVTKQSRADVGTTWSLIRNAVEGVTSGFSKVLEIEGVGYKMAVEGDTVVLSLGYVNPVRLAVPQGLAAAAEKNAMTISGMSKDLVGRFAAEIRAQKKPEPYKGKGIHYRGEVIRRKAGKKATTTAG
jgi:large subunit ribosomal protein L6